MSLVEVMVVVTIATILMLLAAPSFGRWAQNSRTRTVAEVLQNGLRMAQAESARRSRQVMFTLTDAPQLNAVPSVTGKSWSIQTVPLLGAEVGEFIQGAALGNANANVVVTAATAVITFNSLGRLTGAASANTYDITNSAGNRPLRVNVNLSGQIRMCDPAQTLATSATAC
jgi:type IV fimbrial biogenesis protein FimT